MGRLGDCRASFEAALESIHDASVVETHGAEPYCLLGSAVEAVAAWLLDRPTQIYSASESQTTTPAAVPISSSALSAAGLLDLLGALGRSMVGAVGEDDDPGADAEAMPRDLDNQPAIRSLSGVVLHCFFSAEPPYWNKEVSARCASNGIAVNLWGVASFDTQNLGLVGLVPFAQETGGRSYAPTFSLYIIYTQQCEFCS